MAKQQKGPTKPKERQHVKLRNDVLELNTQAKALVGQYVNTVLAVQNEGHTGHVIQAKTASIIGDAESFLTRVAEIEQRHPALDKVKNTMDAVTIGTEYVQLIESINTTMQPLVNDILDHIETGLETKQ